MGLNFTTIGGSFSVFLNDVIRGGLYIMRCQVPADE